MNFYQVDNLTAVIARLRELKDENTVDVSILLHLCQAGEAALKTHTEDAYNAFMAECGALLKNRSIAL